MITKLTITVMYKLFHSWNIIKVGSYIPMEYTYFHIHFLCDSAYLNGLDVYLLMINIYCCKATDYLTLLFYYQKEVNS